MLTNAMVYPTLPATDLQRARKFYEEKLGLRVIAEDPSPGILFQAGRGCMFYVYRRTPTRADHTVAAFWVDDIEAQVNELRSKGIKFEEYDRPEINLRTVDGIASRMGNMKAAWFKDTEGNIIGIVQMALSDLKEAMQPTAGAQATR